jgi:tetratricopeptide (TPR) repeat protein
MRPARARSVPAGQPPGSRGARSRLRGSCIALLLPLAVGCASPRPPPPTVARAPADAAALLRQADAAFATGQHEAAASLYLRLLAADPDHRRALFRLGQLATGGTSVAIERLRRYTQLEPRDAWGHMALGDAIARSGAIDEALAQYTVARRLAPDEPDVAAGRSRILRDAGRIDALIEAQESALSLRPADAHEWIDLGRARQRAGRHAEAAQAYARAHVLAQDARSRGLRDGALAEAATSVQPYAGRSVDSDDNEVTRAGLEVLAPAGQRARVGVRAERARVADPATDGTADRALLVAQWRPRHAWRLDTSAGVARLSTSAAELDSGTGHVRVRWRESFDSPAADLHVLRQPLVASPQLLAQPVTLSEARAMVEAPMTPTWSARLRWQRGRLADATQTNDRTGTRAALVLRLRPTVEFSASAGRLEYERPGSAGYFAPRRVEAAEFATYFEYYDAWPFTIAVDGGAGRQRTTEHGAQPGPWRGAFRVWFSAAWDPAPGVQLALEVDHDRSQVAGTATATAADWRATSALLSLRFGVLRRNAESLTTDRSDWSTRPHSGRQ